MRLPFLLSLIDQFFKHVKNLMELSVYGRRLNQSLFHREYQKSFFFEHCIKIKTINPSWKTVEQTILDKSMVVRSVYEHLNV